MTDGAEPPEPTSTASPSAWPVRSLQALRDPQTPLAPGARVDRYEVIELLGEGSMGAVYRARDLDLGREVALKRIKPGRVALWRAQTRLHREAQAMARVEHESVVRVYNVGIANNQLFIAMELARGGSVSAWAKASRRSWREVVRVFIDAGRGLAAAHRAGVIHRDIKPSNLLLDAHGRAKVSDFGVARVLEDDRDDDDEAMTPSDVAATYTGAVIGTVAYMSPEQLTGGAIDARADQFAFCVALWKLLCAQWPFPIAPSSDASSAPEAFHRAIVAGQVAPARGRAVPHRILALVRRGLAADRAARWASMDELLDALERAARPRRARWLALVASVGLATVGAAAWSMRTDDARAPVTPAPAVCGTRDQLAGVWTAAAKAAYLAAGHDTELARQDAAWFDAYARELAHAYADACGHAAPARIQCLDGALDDLRSALARSPRERTYWPRLRAIDRCGQPWRERDAGSLLGTESALVSPDARQVVFWRPGQSPTIYDLEGRGQQPLAFAQPVRWLADGSIVGRTATDELVVLDPARPGARSLGHPRGVLIDVSPDLALTATWEHEHAAIAPVAGGAPVFPATGSIAMPSGAFSPTSHRFAMWSFTPELVLEIDDLPSRQRTTIPLRVHLNGTGAASAAWIDDHQLLINGGVTADVAGDLWRLRIDDAGRWVGPPEVWMQSERDTALTIANVQAGRILISRSRLGSRNFVFDPAHGERVELLKAEEWLLPLHVDRSHARVLAANNTSGTRLSWMSLDGTQVTPLPRFDGFEHIVAAPHGLLAIDPHSQPPALVAFDDRGVERGRLALAMTWPSGHGPRLRCARARCVMRWDDAHGANTVVIDDRDGRPVLGHPVRAAEFPDAYRSWDLSADGRWIVGPANTSVRTLLLYDVERGTVRHVECQRCANVDRVKFMPDGGLALSTMTLGALKNEPYALVTREPDGREQIVWRGDQYVNEVLPLDDHKILLSTISYDSKLGLLEPPP